MYIEGELTTKFGKATFACTDNDHVAISSGALNVSPLVVRGVEYHAHIHLFLLTDWDVHDYHGLYVSRSNQKPVSNPARKTIKEELIRVWTEHVAAHPEVLEQAHYKALEREYESVSDKLGEAQTQVDELTEKREKIRQELHSLLGV